MRQTLLSSATILSLALVACRAGPGDAVLTPINNPPVADAGRDISQTSDSLVDLDGSGSYDPDGDDITYTWSFDRVPEGSALLDTSFPGNHTSTPRTSFYPDRAGTYIVSLVVTDSKGLSSSPDLVVVTITAGTAPVADAGADQSGTAGDTFQLDGSGSYDPLGRTISYSWGLPIVPDGSAATLNYANTATPYFTADKSGVYIASLTVDNGISTSVPDTVVIKVASANPEPPVALAGDDITGVEDCSWVSLDGSGSFDPNGDSLTYQWSVQSKPSGSTASNDSFDDRTSATPKFFPDVAGEYTLSLAVSDGTTWSTPDLVNITADERSYNTAPTVDAGTDQSVDGGSASCTQAGYSYICDSCADQVVTLGGDASVTDADGDPYTVSWTATSGSATIADSSSLSTTAKLSNAEPTEPGACEDNDFEFELSVTDCTGAVVTDTVTVTVSCCGTADTGSRR